MSDFFRELMGVKCNFATTDGEYRNYVLRDISNEWIVVEKGNDAVYLNLAHVVSIKVSSTNDDA